MIRQRIGDLLEIHDANRVLYVVVLTKVVMFGGNIVFAFHGTSKRDRSELSFNSPGFNICTDLLLAKRENRVQRLDYIEDVGPFWRSHSTKQRVTERTLWYVTPINDLRTEIGRFDTLPDEHDSAMYRSLYSLDLVFDMADRDHTWRGYTQYIKIPPQPCG